MKSFFTSSTLFFIASLFVACEYFSTTTYTPQQISQASQWSEKDQLPSFEVCQDTPEQDRFLCFKNTISSAVSDALDAESLVANQLIDQEISLLLTVDKTGEITLAEIENSNDLMDALPELSAVLEAAIAGLPFAIPAKKSNVGIEVATQLKLPIRITASEQ